MSLIARLFSLQEAFAQARARFSHPAALSDLNMPFGNSTAWATETGCLLSVIQIFGCRDFVLKDNHEAHVDYFSNAFRPYILQGTTDFCWVHNHQDELPSNERAIREALNSLIAVSRVQGYRNEIFINEMIEVLRSAIQSESTYLCIWTLREEGIRSPKKGIPLLSPGNQDTNGFYESSAILQSHKAKVESIEEHFKTAGIHAKLMDNVGVGKMLAKHLDPDTNENFMPRLFGHVEKSTASSTFTPVDINSANTHYTLRAPGDLQKGIKGIDYTCVFPPKIADQIWNMRPTYESDFVTVGERSYASILITLHPDTPVSFERLVKNMKVNGVPFRIAMHSKTKSTAMLSSKYVLATFLKKVPGTNELLQRSIKNIRHFIKSQGSAISLQMVMTIWAPSNNTELLRQRIEQAIKAINSWGSAQAKLMSDDSLFGLVSTLAPYRSRSVAPASVGPANEVLYLAPITRPSLPWTEGGVLFAGITGKLLPFQPLSDELTHHVYLVCGEPGYGKSLLCQVIIIAIAETHELLPHIAITDVGPSSLGTVRYLQSILPDHKKHQVTYIELRNEKRMSINRFDTPLGLRYPLAEDFENIRDWLLLGVSDSQTGESQTGMDSLIADVIRLAYDRSADTGPRSEPKCFEEGFRDDKYWKAFIQPALDRHEITIKRESVIWQMVDTLFDLGEFRAAALLQRFAVPLLEDIVSAANSSVINETYRQQISPDFTLAHFAQMRLVALKNELFVTALPTQFDLTDVRVTAFNLEPVIRKSDTPSSKRYGSLFFGLTSALQVEPFFWDKDRVNEVPVRFREFHRRNLALISRTRNLYFADEQHHFTGIAAADRIPDNIATMGRKRGIGVMLSTQLPRYFTKTMIELSTMRFYVGFQKSSIEGVRDVMKLNDNETYLLSENIKKPNRHGSHMLIQVEAESGNYSQFVNLRVGIRKLWGLSTKSTSSEIRDSITQEFGYEIGLDLLKSVFPSGEAESEYERLRAQLSDTGTGSTGLEENTINNGITDIVEYMINQTIHKGYQLFPELIRGEQKNHLNQ